VNPYGYANFANNVSSIVVPLNPVSLNITTGGTNGGYYNTILGSGFPTDKTKISVTICGKVATIVSSNNLGVKFFQPSCATQTAQTVSIQVGSLTNSSLIFTYTSASNSAPVINSISPATQNPAIKGTLTINGTGFGLDQTQIGVFLSNSSGKVYKLKVISINDSIIVAGLPGGYPGTFTVQITKPDTSGDSIPATVGADEFQYLFSITSISPNTGSYNGGTLITITGNNFSPAYSDTLVYIGDTLNWFCNIETITKTQITCRTPDISKYYAPGSAQRVVISTKLYQFNSCPGDSCNFTYLTSALSPNLTSIS
jgi:IPT/TIG domain